MVITKDMPVSGIVSAWSNTATVLNERAIPLSPYKALKENFQGEDLDHILQKLNEAAGSSSFTCQEGA
ncbi:MAG: hypothetical protein EA344_04185 [Alkalicoccus sp.]|nr:MAG: hypothetical protein EA344_04185 [Alkalicoccus sp.]